MEHLYYQERIKEKDVFIGIILNDLSNFTNKYFFYTRCIYDYMTVLEEIYTKIKQSITLIETDKLQQYLNSIVEKHKKTLDNISINMKNKQQIYDVLQEIRTIVMNIIKALNRDLFQVKELFERLDTKLQQYLELIKDWNNSLLGDNEMLFKENKIETRDQRTLYNACINYFEHGNNKNQIYHAVKCILFGNNFKSTVNNNLLNNFVSECVKKFFETSYSLTSLFEQAQKEYEKQCAIESDSKSNYGGDNDYQNLSVEDDNYNKNIISSKKKYDRKLDYNNRQNKIDNREVNSRQDYSIRSVNNINITKNIANTNNKISKEEQEDLDFYYNVKEGKHKKWRPQKRLSKIKRSKQKI